MLMLVSVFLYVEHNQTPNTNNVLNQLDEHAFSMDPKTCNFCIVVPSFFIFNSSIMTCLFKQSSKKLPAPFR